ncbi:MAG: sugar ABC transporter permease, partial [Clostridiales bacterium]|nr:sugar ABC transporter permease [Clostridiales bacterium]
PYVCSVVALTSMWRLVLDTNYGILNDLVTLLGGEKVNWLSNEKTYMPVMILMGAWTNLGFNVILFSAALTGIPKSYYEAAKIDGAGRLTQFFKITFPLISPTTFYLLVMGLIGAIQDFTRFQAIGFGETGPNNAGLTMVFYLYQQGFVNNYTYGMGFAAATSWIVAILILGLTVFNFKVSKKWVHYDD